MAKGSVKWFDASKGFGFITPESGAADLFAHKSNINMDGITTLEEGASVTFDIATLPGKSDKQAVNIQYQT